MAGAADCQIKVLSSIIAINLFLPIILVCKNQLPPLPLIYF
jgi:hypothetical protein